MLVFPKNAEKNASIIEKGLPDRVCNIELENYLKWNEELLPTIIYFSGPAKPLLTYYQTFLILDLYQV